MDEGWLRVSTVVLLASFPSVGIQARAGCYVCGGFRVP